jgi:hypothetical protein
MAVLGAITVNEIEVMEVDASPKTSGVDASTGSIAANTDGSFLYLKDGQATTDWASIGTEFFYSISGANQTKNTATYSNITELTSEILPIGTYNFKCHAICQSSAATAGVGLRIGAGTAALGSTFAKWSITQAANGVGSNFEYDQLNSTTNVSATAASSANTDFLAIGSGIIVLTSSGTIAIQIRSENTTTVSIRTGSCLFIKRLV